MPGAGAAPGRARAVLGPAGRPRAPGRDAAGVPGRGGGRGVGFAGGDARSCACVWAAGLVLLGAMTFGARSVGRLAREGMDLELVGEG